LFLLRVLLVLVFKTCRRPPNAKLVVCVVVIIFIKQRTRKVMLNQVSRSHALGISLGKKKGESTLSTGVKESLSFVVTNILFFVFFRGRG